MTKAALAFERPPEEFEYPESDGEPMAETDEHRDELAEIVFTLKDHFRGQHDVLRRNVEDLCALLGIKWSAERSTAVAGMSTAQFEALRADLLSQKRWP